MEVAGNRLERRESWIVIDRIDGRDMTVTIFYTTNHFIYFVFGKCVSCLLS